ncbi:MAG: DNA-binding protein [Comamonadaceae bacterium]|nr:MAG: DNA-binding protein [Comamonadaceae bacterium]
MFLPLDQVTRPTVTTEEAAFYVNRRPQTLRCWAMGQTGPLNPRRIGGRLAWSVADLRALLGVA